MRIRPFGAAVALLGSAILTVDARAAIVVQTDRGQILKNQEDSETGKWVVRLRSIDSTGPTTFWIDGDGNDDIQLIEVQAENPGQVTKLRIGGGGLGNIRDIDRIERTDGTIQDIWLEKMRIRRDLGDTDITVIVDAIVGGDVTGDIRMLPRPFGGRTNIISLIVRGDHVGDIDAPEGGIQTMLVDGVIGTVEAPVAINVSGNIKNLRASEIHAHVDTATYENPGFPGGYLGRFETIASLDGSGVFTGSLHTKSFTGSVQDPGIYLDGPLEADVRFDDNFSWGIAEIVLPTGGLRSQIIINGSNVGAAWTDPIKIGEDGDPEQIVLSNALYPETPAQVGGGSVGKAAFRLHKPACAPPHLGVGDSEGPVILRHYGPVKWESGAPVMVESRPRGSSEEWVDVTSDFVFTQTDPRDVEIHPLPGDSFDPALEHRVLPVRSGAGALRCDEVDGSPLVELDDPTFFGYDYRFTVKAGCAADLNGDGAVNASDLALALGGWGVCSGPCAADLNGDGEVNASDLALLLGGWGGC